jgi:hypothetical protein
VTRLVLDMDNEVDLPAINNELAIAIQEDLENRDHCRELSDRVTRDDRTGMIGRRR